MAGTKKGDLVLYSGDLFPTEARKPPSNKALEVRASGERNESFALGKRFAVAKLTASLSPRAKLRLRLRVTSGRHFSSPEI